MVISARSSLASFRIDDFVVRRADELQGYANIIGIDWKLSGIEQEDKLSTVFNGVSRSLLKNIAIFSARIQENAQLLFPSPYRLSNREGDIGGVSSCAWGDVASGLKLASIKDNYDLVVPFMKYESDEQGGFRSGAVAKIFPNRSNDKLINMNFVGPIHDYVMMVNIYMRPLSCQQHISIGFCSIRSAFGDFQRFFHVTGLLGSSIYSLPEPSSLQSKNNELQAANQSENAGKFDQPPIGGQFILSLFAILGGFALSLWGWQCFDNKRRLFGSALIGGGWLLGGLGFFWWVAS